MKNTCFRNSLAKAITSIALAAIVILSENWAEAQPYLKNTHYYDSGPALLEKDDGRIEVLELMWYGCNHCLRIKPIMDQWKDTLPDDVRHVRRHIHLPAPADIQARIFLTVEAIDKNKHEKIFEIFLEKKSPPKGINDLHSLIKILDVNPDTFWDIFNSPEINAKMKQLQDVTAKHTIPGVPAIIVNGKYRTDIAAGKGPENMIKIVDYLINMERQAKQK